MPCHWVTLWQLIICSWLDCPFVKYSMGPTHIKISSVLPLCCLRVNSMDAMCCTSLWVHLVFSHSIVRKYNMSFTILPKLYVKNHKSIYDLGIWIWFQCELFTSHKAEVWYHYFENFSSTNFWGCKGQKRKCRLCKSFYAFQTVTQVLFIFHLLAIWK